MDIYTLAGLAGFGVYVAAYALLQFRVFSGDGLGYTAANTVAAALVLISLVADFNLAAALIQISWITIGVAGVIMRWSSSPSRLNVWRASRRQPTIRIGRS